MRNSVIAIVLCFLAVAAGAQCAALAPAPGAEQTAMPGLISTSTTHADTQQELPMDDGPPVMRAAAPQPKNDEKEPRGTGTAMVLAAVAVMSGIALRRYGTHMR